MELDFKKIELIIERDENKKCTIRIPDLNNTNINLSESSTDDIEEFFNNVFDNKMMIEFFTNDKENDLYNEVAQELILQLNQEIAQSENIFEEIIRALQK